MYAPPGGLLAEVLGALTHYSPDGMVVVSADGRFVYANARFAEIWRFPPEVMGLGEDSLALEAATGMVRDPEAFLQGVHRAYAAGVRTHDLLEMLDGRVLDRHGVPLRDASGADLGWAWYFRDVTELRQAETQQRALADTLQASLLPPRPPTVPGMDVATRYRPGDTDLLVGGDFFDVFRLGSNAWGLVVGDVCGKGAGAASLTALTRYTLRAAAVHHALPSAVLDEVNAGLVADAPVEADDRFCTVVYARLELDVCGAWVTLACAGHPRPIVVRRAGWIDLRGQAGTPVGMFDTATATDDRVGLGPGDALLFCTDGITEARNAAGEEFGDEALPSVLLACAGEPAEVIAERVLDGANRFAAGRARDDVALLVVRVPPDAKENSLERLAAATGVPANLLDLPGYPVGDPHGGLWHQRPLAPREARVALPADVASVPATRRFLAGVLRSWRMPEVIEGDVLLLSSELATNAVRHAGSDFTVIVRYDGERLRVEVGDGSRAMPRKRSPELDDVSGRGLVLVDVLAAAWGVLPTLEGKRVWFEVPAAVVPRG
jgi:anti-sigma regulatory factor (Ser/Thr protein kinase)